MPLIASSKVTMTMILSQRIKRGPGNETLKKWKEQTAFYDRFQPSAGPSIKEKIIIMLPKQLDCVFGDAQNSCCGKKVECFGLHGKMHGSTFLHAV